MGISKRYTTKRNKKAPKEVEGTLHDYESSLGGGFYRVAHYKKLKPHKLSREDWCLPTDMEQGDYRMMDPACEVNEKGTR